RERNALHKCNTLALCRQQFVEWFVYELFKRLIHQAAKGGVRIAHDVRRSLDCGHGQRRVLCSCEEKARRVDKVIVDVFLGTHISPLFNRFWFWRGLLSLPNSLRYSGGQARI